MKIMMIAVIRAGSSAASEIAGFRFIDVEAKSPKPFADTYERTKLCLSKGTLPFGNIALQNGEVRGVGGDIARYTSIDMNGNKLGEDSWIILSQLTGGYKVCNYQGIIKSFKESDIAEKLKLANGKIVTRGDKKIVSAISGEYEKGLPQAQEKPKMPEPLDKTEMKGIASPDTTQSQGNPEPLVEEMDTPYLSEEQKLYNMGRTHTGYSSVKLEDIKDEHSQYDCGTKLRRALFTMREWSPLYFAILTKLDRVATTQIETMGVSLNEFVINPHFLAHLTEPELMFVLYHEVFHIVLGHTFRCGPNRDKETWNIAADLIVNQYIINDFSTSAAKLERGKTIMVGGKPTLITQITAQADGCYGNVDLAKDTAESIYDELQAGKSVQTTPLKMSNTGMGTQGGTQQGQSGASGSGQQGQSGTQQGQNGASSSGQQGQSGAQQGMGTQGGTQQGMGTQGGGQQGQSGTQQGQGDGQSGAASDNDTIGQVVKTDFSFRGQHITSQISLDLDDRAVQKATSGNAQNIAEAELKRILTSASIASKKTRGTVGTGALGDRIKMMLAPQVNWRLLLERFVSVSTEAIYTYARPDRRFLWKGEVLPGPKKEKNKLKDLIIAIDTSGSISTEQLALAAGHIWNIYKKYNVNAIVVYWDTQVRRVEEIKRRSDIVNMMPPRGGGTAVNSFLAWFKQRTMGGHKALDPCAVLVITDGYIESNEEINEASKGMIKVRYSDKFIWLITDDDNYMNWKPPYGKKVRYLR